MNPMLKVFALTVPFIGTTMPALTQDNALGIHLNQQLWNRLQDHQNQSRQTPPSPRVPTDHADLVKRIKTNLSALEAGIPQARNLAVDREGRVHITVSGPVEEGDVIAFAQNLLGAEVLIVSETGAGRSLLPYLIGLREAMTSTIDRTAALAAGIPNLPTELVTVWEQAVRATYDPDEMIPIVILLFAQKMTRDAEAEAISFFQSPIGEKLRNARQAIRELAPEPYDVMLEREQALAKSNPRLHGLYFDLGAALQGDPDFTEAQLLLRVLLRPAYGQARTEEYIAMFMESARNSLPNSRTIYAMQLLPEAPESELEAILDFYRSPAGQQLAHVETIMYFAVIEAAIEALSSNLSARLNDSDR